METKENLHIIGFIIASDYRTKVIFALQDEMKTPKNISKETNIPINHVSNILKELLNKDLVLCETPELKKGRLYSLTEKGKHILKKIKNI